MRFLSIAFVSLALVAACGGTSGSPLDDGGTSDGTTGNDGAAPNDAGNVPDVAKPDVGPACPLESGSYSVQLSGAGCGDTSSSPTECITQNQCTITLDFGGGSGKALKGTTPIKSDGSFDNAQIEEGSTTRTGCIGTWDEQTSTLTVDCGGTSSTQSCIATLTRTGTCQ